MKFGRPVVNFSRVSGDVPRLLQSYDIFISQLVQFARSSTSVLDFHSNNLQITSKLLTQSYRYYRLRKTLKKNFIAKGDFVTGLSQIALLYLLFS